MKNYKQISVNILASQIDALSDCLFELGALSISMTDAKDEPLFQLTPGEEKFWRETTLHALFDKNSDCEAIISTIKNIQSQFKTTEFLIQTIEDKNWVIETQKQFSAKAFGHLWICPMWEKETFDARDKKILFLEPGLAFGTGTHPTTQLCLTWLATHDLKHKTVIDYGCGSGILALSALVLGAEVVHATDHDEQALLSTQNNANYNAFEKKLYIVDTHDIKTARADIVIANILANPLIELADTLRNLLKPGGQLILSGILTNDFDRVIVAYQAHFEVAEKKILGEWGLVSFSAR